MRRSSSGATLSLMKTILFFFFLTILFGEAFGNELAKFSESPTQKFDCFGDDDPKCVQAVPDSKKKCVYHDDCEADCPSLRAGGFQCGCLPKTKKCGRMTRKYFEASQAPGNIIGLGSKKTMCRTDVDCQTICEAETARGPGGLDCFCLPEVKLCGLGHRTKPKQN